MSGQIDSAAAKIDPENDLLVAFRPAPAVGRGDPRFDPGRLRQSEPGEDRGAERLSRDLRGSAGRPVTARLRLGQIDAGRAAARSVFVHVKRSLAVPMLAAFDAPDPDAPCPVRFTTTQPTQAPGHAQQRVLSNSQAAKSSPRRLTEKAGADRDRQVTFVLRRVLQRTPTTAEIDRGLQFLALTQPGRSGFCRRSAAAILPADLEPERVCVLGMN